MSGFLLLANAEAGSAEDDRVEAARAALAGAGDVEVVRTDSTVELDRALTDAGDRRVVVAGGDGSIHLAVQLLWSRDPQVLRATELGLVPLGTGNDLAGGLGLPEDPAEAARVCVEGRPRALDLIVADTGQVVVNAVHAGLGAAAAERASALKDALGPLAYPIGALIAGVREAGFELDVTLDGRTVHRGSTLMVGVANGPRIGGGTRLAPAAVLDDGLLDLIVVSAVKPAARLGFGAALRNEAHVNRDDVLHATGLEVVIAGEPVTHDLDGELTEELERVTYTVHPKAWRLLTP
jgi:YegS/Rv2252/BmrU family lipid kinase